MGHSSCFARHLRPLLVCAVLTLVALPGLSSAQVRETQVPLLPERGLVEVDATLRSRLALFGEFNGFRMARLFQTADGGYILEITVRDGDRVARERRVLDKVALTELRALLLDALEQTGAAVTQDGRAGLILGHTALGLGFYGWAIPNATGMEDTRGPVATYLLASGASFLIPYLATASSDVTLAHRTSSLWGASRGIWSGWLLGGVLGAGMDNHDRDDLGLALGVATSIAGSILGYKSVDWSDLSHGQVQLRNVMGDFGLFGGMALAAGIGLYDDKTADVFGDFASYDTFEERWEGNLFTLGAAGVTTAAGMWMSSSDEYSVGDARLLRTTGILGATIGLAAADLMSDNNDQAMLLGVAAGAGLGALLGHTTLIEDRDFTSGQGLLVTAGQIAGGLIGMGIGVLVDEDADSELFTSAAAVGSLAGYALSYGAFRGEAERSYRNRSGTPSGGLDIQFQLSGLLLPLMNRNGNSGGFTSAPILTIRF